MLHVFWHSTVSLSNTQHWRIFFQRCLYTLKSTPDVACSASSFSSYKTSQSVTSELHSETILYFCVEVRKNMGVPDASSRLLFVFEFGFMLFMFFII